MKKKTTKKTSTKSATPRLFTEIKRDHRLIDSLFAKILKTSDRGAKNREKIYLQLRDVISRHTRGEESAIYPRLQAIPESEAFGTECLEEHGVVKDLISKLDGTPPQNREFVARITVMKEAIEHHVEEEESEMFAKLKRLFSKEELDTMAVDFVAAKRDFLEKVRDLVAA